MQVGLRAVRGWWGLFFGVGDCRGVGFNVYKVIKNLIDLIASPEKLPHPNQEPQRKNTQNLNNKLWRARRYFPPGGCYRCYGGLQGS